MQNIIGILSQTDLFDNLTATQVELIAALCEPSNHQQGDVLVKENESTTDLYVIGRGAVEILMNPTLVSSRQEEIRDDLVHLTELRVGQVFGEVALVDQGIRSATVRVVQDNTLLLRISRERLMLLCDTYPEMGYKLMKNVAADLALKIRNTDLTIRQYQLLLSRKE